MLERKIVHVYEGTYIAPGPFILYGCCTVLLLCMMMRILQQDMEYPGTQVEYSVRLASTDRTRTHTRTACKLCTVISNSGVGLVP